MNKKNYTDNSVFIEQSGVSGFPKQNTCTAAAKLAIATRFLLQNASEIEQKSCR